MKNKVLNIFTLLAMVGMMFTACKKEYPEPPIQDLPIGTVYTIADILEMESGTVFNYDASVYGIVTADEQSGNLYKAAFIQDRATGAALELHLDAVSGVRIGDSIRVYLKDVTYSLYNNLPQLSNFEADGHIIILANLPKEKHIQPALTTIANINAGQHLAGLVRLENVRFTEKNTFADPSGYGNRTLADPSDYSQTVIVRTSNYANFANDSLPQGTGNLTAIATVYGSTWQLYIRSARELEFEGYVPGEDSGLPYYQDFASSFGTYTTYDVLGPQSWEIDYNTAKMTGYVNSTNNENEDWLISARFSLEGVSQASMTMKYIARYFANLNNDITIQVSNDYVSGDPRQASWTELSANLSEGSNWTDFYSTTIDLSQFAGQKICVAVKYLSDNVKAGTIEVQSILIQEGSGPTPPPGPGTGGEVQNMPYTQNFASEFGTYMTYDELGPQSWEIDYSTAKMTGYVNPNYFANVDWLISSPVAITGVNDAKMTMKYIGRYFTNINNEVTIWASTNYTWGSDPTQINWIPVTADLREGSNWTDFLTAEIPLTQFVGQTVTFAVKYTSTDSKAGTMEIQSITIEEGGGVGPNPPTPGGEVQSMPYSQSFATEFGTYTTVDVTGPQSWMIDYSTAKMTGYENSTNNANEDWLISSPVAITGVSDAKMTMVYIARYFNNISDVTIWASTDYTWGSAPTSASWTEVPATLIQGNNWNDFTTADISLTQCVGQTVTLAVKYVSDDVKAGTIEIQSITIQEGSGEEPPTPPTPPGPGAGSGTASDPYNVSSGIGLQGQSVTAWVQGYIVGAVRNGLSTVTSNDDVIWSIPVDSYTNVVIADDVTCREIANCIIVNLPSGKPLRTQVNLYDNPGNYGKQLAVLGTLRNYFGQAGLRDSNGTEADFVLEGGVTPPTPGTEIFSESFATGQGNFTIEDVNLPSGLSYVWQHAPSYSCMKASAYVSGQNYAAESWLVSPAINLSGVSSAKLSFSQAVNYASPQGTLCVMISTNYNGNVSNATWTELNLDQWPAGNNWTFITSTTDLTSYVGQTVTIAFKYTSSTSVSATWEVKDFVVE